MQREGSIHFTVQFWDNQADGLQAPAELGTMSAAPARARRRSPPRCIRQDHYQSASVWIVMNLQQHQLS